MDGGSDDLVFPDPVEDDGQRVVHATYDVDGEPVAVAIRAEETTIAYASGSERSVPTGSLRFCPECMKAGDYPLSEGGGFCPDHDAAMLPFSLDDYERFQLVHQYELGTRRL